MKNSSDVLLLKKIDDTSDKMRHSVGKQPIVALLSGGKDSALAIFLAKRASLNVKLAVHLTSRWSFDILLTEAKKISGLCDIPLKVVDTSKELLLHSPNGIIGSKEIACRRCTFLKFEVGCQICKEMESSIILSGYSKADSIYTVIVNYLGTKEKSGESLELNSCSKYILGQGFMELRPIISFDIAETKRALEIFGIEISSTHEIGLFSYDREGCTIPYVDKGVAYTETLLDQSKLQNERIRALAKKHNVRASIYVPSGRILTRPSGYERILEMELKKNHKSRKAFGEG